VGLFKGFLSGLMVAEMIIAGLSGVCVPEAETPHGKILEI